MFIKTAHQTVFGLNSQSQIVHLALTDDTKPLFLEAASAAGGRIPDGPLSGFDMIRQDNGVAFTKDGKFLSAEPDEPRLVCDRDEALDWETFQLFDDLDTLQRSLVPSFDQFVDRVQAMISAREPIKLHIGCGPVPRPGFINLDVVVMDEAFLANHPLDYFIFPYADVSWRIPDNCVDYIFHEDFIEHISQLQQIQFLAEAWRVLKPGGYHRVNTPNLLWTMATRSNFRQGLDGVYTGELEWGHIALFSPQSLKEIADMIGYSEVRFTRKSQGGSPFAVTDFRPGSDRDEIHGNIYADLVK